MRIRLIAAALAVGAFAVSAGVALGVAGDLDPKFGSGGVAILNSPETEDIAYGGVVLKDGTIFTAGLAFGATDDFAFAKFDKKGQLKKAKTTDIGGDEQARGIALSGSRLIAAGRSDVGSDDDFALVAYSKSGSVDKSFGVDGIVLTDFGGNERGRAVAVDANKNIVVVGTADTNGTDTALARYLPKGGLDTSFSGDGKMTIDLSGAAFYDDAVAVAIQPDGKIVTAGSMFSGSDFDMVVARFLPDGTPDSTFDGDGKAILNLGGQDAAFSVALQTDGGIFVGGSSNGDAAVARFTSIGAPSAGFNGVGYVITDLGGSDDAVNGITTDSGGRAVAAGATNSGGDYDFALLRYTSPGVLDTSFSGDGIVTTDLGDAEDGARAVGLWKDTIVVIGESTVNGTDDFALVRYLAVTDPSEF